MVSDPVGIPVYQLLVTGDRWREKEKGYCSFQGRKTLFLFAETTSNTTLTHLTGETRPAGRESTHDLIGWLGERLAGARFLESCAHVGVGMGLPNAPWPQSVITLVTRSMVVCLCRTTCMCWGECCSRTVDERGGEAVDAAVCGRAGNVDRPHAAGRVVALNGDRASGDTATQGGVRQQHVPSRTHAQGMPVRPRHFLSTAILTLHALVCVFEIAS